MKTSIYVFVAICTSAALGYADALPYPFQFDDLTAIVYNPGLRSAQPFSELWTSAPERFVAYLTFLADFSRAGLDPLAFRLTNVVIHALTAFFLFLLSTRLFALDSAGRPQRIPAWFLPALVALLFVAHPLQTQAVTYIHQRFASLCALFYVISLYAFVEARLSSIAASRYAVAWTSAAVGAGLLAVFTKENAATLPVAAGLLEWLFVHPRIKNRKRSILAVAPLAVVTAAVPLTALLKHGGLAARIGQYGDQGLTSYGYFCTQLRVIWLYIRLAVWPSGLNLDHDITPSASLLEPAVAAGGLAALAACAAALWLSRDRKIAAFGILFVFIALAVESSFIPIRDLAFEHRMYLPLFGLALLAAAAVDAGLGASGIGLSRRPAVAAGIVALTAVSLAELTRRRNEVWASPVTLWSDVVEKSPAKRRGYVNLGIALAREGRQADAVAVYERLLEIAPDDGDALYELTVAYAALGRPEADAFLTRFAAVAQGDARVPYAQATIAVARGAYAEAEAALVAAETIARSERAGTPRAKFLYYTAIMRSRLARRRHAFDEARAMLVTTQTDYPDDPTLALERASLELEAGHPESVPAYAAIASRAGGASASLARIVEADHLEALGLADQASAVYQGLLQQRTSDPLSLLQAAAGLIRLGYADDMTAVIGALTSAAPSPITTAVTTARELRAALRLDEARRLLAAASQVCLAPGSSCTDSEALKAALNEVTATYEHR